MLQLAARAHHPHNKLIPADEVQQLLNISVKYELTSVNVDAVHQLLAMSCLSMILKVNFNQLTENKLYAVVVMQYGQIMETIVQEIGKEGH